MSLGTAYAIKKRGQKCMAKGGMVDLKEQDSIPSGGMESEKDSAPAAQEESKPSMFGMAKGGEVSGLDMIHKIMEKHYSHGGMVANDVGEAAADKLPAEYDDLVLRDDLEDDSGAGNEKGASDMVDNIMKKRKPK